MHTSKLTHKILFLLSGFFLFSLAGCSNESEPDSELNFDQGAMLTNIGENIILPNYATFSQEAATLQQAVSDFTAQPTEEHLEDARQALKDVYLAWQMVNLYEFGPAEDLALRQNLNEFPSDFPKIETNISSGSWDLESFTSVKLKGLPALDYLLFKEGTAAETLADYTSGENAANRLRYLQDVADQVNELATEVYNAWNPAEGNYIETFTTNLGNNAGSSLSLLVNQLNQGYEVTKNKRLNYPLGNRTVGGEPIPKAVEAYYSGISLDLIKANLSSVENTFKGQANGTNGLGLDDNLNAHYEAGNIEDNLTEKILTQLSKARAAVDAIPGPLSEAVVTSYDKGNAAYNELQDLVIYLKTDMPQVLSVLISYIDNDGD